MKFRILLSLLVVCSLVLSGCSLSAVARDLGNYWLQKSEPAAPAEPPTEPSAAEGPATEESLPVTESPTVADIVGEYTIHSITRDSITVDKATLALVLQEYDLELDDLFFLELKSDGTGRLIVTDPSTMEKVDAEIGWDDQRLWPLDDPTDLAAYTYRDDQISMTVDGVTMVLQKTVLSV